MELLAEEQLNPRGEERADLRAAQICFTTASVFGGGDVDIETFMPDFQREEKVKKEVTLEEFDGKLRCWGAGLKRIQGK
jgi:hypothetical protein